MLVGMAGQPSGAAEEREGAIGMAADPRPGSDSMAPVAIGRVKPSKRTRLSLLTVPHAALGAGTRRQAVCGNDLAHGLEAEPSSSTRNIEQCSEVASSRVMTRSRWWPGARWRVEPHAAMGARSRHRRCLPRPGAASTQFRNVPFCAIQKRPLLVVGLWYWERC